MSSIVVTLTSPPERPALRRALALAEELAGQGHRLTLCCLQDSVFVASDRAPGEARVVLDRLLDGGARCLAVREDLLSRGLAAGPRVSAVDHAAVVESLLAGHDRVLGAF